MQVNPLPICIYTYWAGDPCVGLPANAVTQDAMEGRKKGTRPKTGPVPFGYASNSLASAYCGVSVMASNEMAYPVLPAFFPTTVNFT